MLKVFDDLNFIHFGVHIFSKLTFHFLSTIIHFNECNIRVWLKQSAKVIIEEFKRSREVKF